LRSPRNSAWSTLTRFLPGMVISIVGLFIVFRFANWKDLLKVISNVQPVYPVLVILLTLIYIGFRAVAWKTLLEDRVTFWQSFWTLNIGYLLNNLFPFRAGEFGRAIVLGQSSGLGMMRVFPTIVIERAFDLAFAAISLLITLPLALGMSWIKPIANATLGLVIAGIFSLYLMARNSAKVHDWVHRFGQRWHFIQRYISPQLDSFLEGLSVLTDLKRFFLSLLWIGGSWVIAFFVYYVMLWTIVANPPFWWAIFADSVLAMGIAVPSAPAAIGVFEAALVGALSLLGVSNSLALAYAIMMHFLQFLITGILGFYAISKGGRSLKKLFAEVQFRKNMSPNG